MVKQGPIPAFLHSLIEYIAGAALIAAPLLLDYDSGAAKAASIILGVLILFLVATTTSTMSLINQVPLSMHIVFDYVIAAVMIASPFLFGFSDESTPTAVFIAGGVLWLLLSVGTRYRKEETPARGEPKKRRGQAGRLPAEGGTRGGAAADSEGELAVTGGTARDPARREAFLAADDDEPVDMRHVRESSERENRTGARGLTSEEIPEWEPPPRGSSSQ